MSFSLLTCSCQETWSLSACGQLCLYNRTVVFQTPLFSPVSPAWVSSVSGDTDLPHLGQAVEPVRFRTCAVMRCSRKESWAGLDPDHLGWRQEVKQLWALTHQSPTGSCLQLHPGRGQMLHPTSAPQTASVKGREMRLPFQMLQSGSQHSVSLMYTVSMMVEWGIPCVQDSLQQTTSSREGSQGEAFHP